MGADQSADRRNERTNCKRNANKYRSSAKRARDDDGLDRALELLETNDFSNLAHARFPSVVKGPLSWAKLGEYACNQIKRELANLHSEEELLEIAHAANVLQSRHHKRDTIKGARTTKELRDCIMKIASLLASLEEISGVRSGETTPTFEIASRATTLRQLYARLQIRDSQFIKTMVEQAVARVLASSSASPGLKSAFNRLLLHWLPPPPKTSSGGTKISFDSDDDDF